MLDDVATLRPIETPYAGRLFRSRLEARWAVFYSTINIPWVYEPEGFALTPDLWYLPDFFLPQQKCFIEIKPDVPAAEARDKAERLAAHTGCRVFLFFGQPGYHTDGGYPYGQLTAADGAYLFDPVYGGIDNFYTWCVCMVCGRFGIEYDGRSERLPCHHASPGSNKLYTYNDPRVLRAYDRANQARFSRASC